MDNFKASNGMKVPVDGHPFALVNANGVTTQTLSAEDAQALREFFQHERDEELGRWRWPEHPEYVVYAGRSPILILNEMTGDTLRARPEDGHTDTGHGTIYNAAAAYFEDHLERKPWHAAMPGEVWELKVDGIGLALVVDSFGEFQGLVTRSPQSASITDGRRIWPESD